MRHDDDAITDVDVFSIIIGKIVFIDELDIVSNPYMSIDDGMGDGGVFTDMELAWHARVCCRRSEEIIPHDIGVVDRGAGVDEGAWTDDTIFDLSIFDSRPVA